MARLILGGAVVLGAYLRFARLGESGLSRDEGSSWAAAIAPTFREVVTQAHRIDPGTFAFYDLVLHGWIRIFGDGAYAMRSMSAVLGTVSIALLFFVVRDFYAILTDDPDGNAGAMAGAFAAILMATNLAIVSHDRAARMYPMVVAASLCQMWFFARLHRNGRAADYIGVAFFTALAVGTNFTALALPATEAVWLIVLSVAARFNERAASLNVLKPAAGIVAGLLLLLPMAPYAYRNVARGIENGYWVWLRPHSLFWPLKTLWTIAGGIDPTAWQGAMSSRALAYADLACIAVAGWYLRRSGRLLLAFLAVWVTGPMFLIMLVSVLVHPVEFPRYALIAFLGVFALAGTGWASIPTKLIRIIIIVVILFYQSGIDQQYLRNPGVQPWQQAVTEALHKARPGERIVVYPPMGVNVLRYYLKPAQRAIAVPASAACEPDTVLVVSGFEWHRSERIKAASECYPLVAWRSRNVQVRIQLRRVYRVLRNERRQSRS